MFYLGFFIYLRSTFFNENTTQTNDHSKDSYLIGFPIPSPNPFYNWTIICGLTQFILPSHHSTEITIAAILESVALRLLILLNTSGEKQVNYNEKNNLLFHLLLHCCCGLQSSLVASVFTWWIWAPLKNVSSNYLSAPSLEPLLGLRHS